MIKKLEKYVAPSKHCIQPKGTIWEYFVEEGEYKYFIQMGTDEDPIWMPLGQFLENVYVKEFLRKPNG